MNEYTSTILLLMAISLTMLRLVMPTLLGLSVTDVEAGMATRPGLTAHGASASQERRAGTYIHKLREKRISRGTG